VRGSPVRLNIVGVKCKLAVNYYISFSLFIKNSRQQVKINKENMFCDPASPFE
jgi:hypothetical protein